MGKLVEIKTKQTTANAEDFLAGIDDEQQQDDSRIILKLMEAATKKNQKCGEAQ